MFDQIRGDLIRDEARDIRIGIRKDRRMEVIPHIANLLIAGWPLKEAIKAGESMVEFVEAANVDAA